MYEEKFQLGNARWWFHVPNCVCCMFSEFEFAWPHYIPKIFDLLGGEPALLTVKRYISFVKEKNYSANMQCMFVRISGDYSNIVKIDQEKCAT